MKNRPKPINPAMPTNIATVMLTIGVIVGILVGWLLPLAFNSSFILGVIAMLIFDFAFLIIFRRVTVAKQTTARDKAAANAPETTSVTDKKD